MSEPASQIAEKTPYDFVRRYVKIARPDHWIKNIFMIPGVALALAIAPRSESWWELILGVFSLCITTSANYTINEYLDAQFDRFHPNKNTRPGAKGLLNPWFVLLQYFLLGIGGLFLAGAVDTPFLLSDGSLLLMGLVYNVPPIRSKDKAYIDVLSESLNNPIRFLLGWFSVSRTVLPPASVLLAYWMGGAFLMGIKRYSEYRRFNDRKKAALYRRSFGVYTEKTLLLSSFFYALCSVFFIGIFLIKYRIEFVLTFPLFATLFTWYLGIGLRDDSAAQAPEKLYREVAFLGFAICTFLIAAALFFVRMPFLQGLMETRLIQFHGGYFRP